MVESGDRGGVRTAEGGRSAVVPVRRAGRGAAHVAVAVHDGAGAAGLRQQPSAAAARWAGAAAGLVRWAAGPMDCWTGGGLLAAQPGTAADVAVAVDDRAGATRLGARHRLHLRSRGRPSADRSGRASPAARRWPSGSAGGAGSRWPARTPRDTSGWSAPGWPGPWPGTPRAGHRARRAGPTRRSTPPAPWPSPGRPVESVAGTPPARPACWAPGRARSTSGTA